VACRCASLVGCEEDLLVRVIGVLDLMDGRAVHARATGGGRGAYQPVRVVAGEALDPGDAIALARAYLERLGVRELYAADLDAIRGGEAQRVLAAGIARLGAPLWLDAGVRTVAGARDALASGASRVVVGLETLPSFGALTDICRAIGGERVAFSLDLRDGAPVGGDGVVAPGDSVSMLAVRAVDAGAGALIVLDLARVGTGAGVDLTLMRRIRAAAPRVALFAGGGVRGPDDLARLQDAGCDGALVATALHDGRLGAREIAAAGGYRMTAC
jgi:phosphoribosylformimino-5-aminoimidazole carboxamide ribotide isomerase